MKTVQSLLITTLAISVLSGCAVTLPFNNRLSYPTYQELQKEAVDKDLPAVMITWAPSSFPTRIDVQGASGYVGSASQTRIPTGVAMAARISEAISAFTQVSPNGLPLLIDVIEAKSKFEYSAGVFNVTPSLDVGEITFKAKLTLGKSQWVKTYFSRKNDPSIGGMSATGILEAAWDDVASQVARDVAKQLQAVK
ncbi:MULTISPECIES: hypothetical protein [Aeromonas]|uniref:Lipoprotein n=1 Tax=Aeromonas caviae TaxID=648 RepID=A0AAJ6CPP0_AERCA|nr:MULTISPECIES: hypothetical protein [Aeromonas]WFF97177.1 hypothetical protein P5S46_16165 [Aeromonas caviae]